MKLSNFFYNAVTQYLFLISFWLLIKTTKSEFTYTESKFGISSPQKPLITDIKTYKDGTILVRIIRNDSIQTNNDCKTLNVTSLEPILRIRVIHTNDGTTNEIDLNLTDLPMQPINYCLFKNEKNPIQIYPLQNPFILITYMTVGNVSDRLTYWEHGIVIDCYGTNRSDITLWSANVDFSSGNWLYSNKIQLNTDDSLGFLRPYLDNTLQWWQYSV
ncbi:hypothetical protein C2G38_1416108 [Gigaspora rosea]|uniref:Uncharacterized protein n=1 Tax=Gigaspora rosea TaxID=44941 RepID=A0A397V7J4_9GLOM|nr:hypothetical protein C2G38_1416108 [Gigaspora rosea]